MIGNRLRPPSGQPLLLPDGQVSTAWMSFFEDLADQAGLWAALAYSPSYAGNAAAAAGGVPVGAPYRDGSAVHVRLPEGSGEVEAGLADFIRM